jgi:hypothetical protein
MRGGILTWLLHFRVCIIPTMYIIVIRATYHRVDMIVLSFIVTYRSLGGGGVGMHAAHVFVQLSVIHAEPLAHGHLARYVRKVRRRHSYSSMRRAGTCSMHPRHKPSSRSTSTSPDGTFLPIGVPRTTRSRPSASDTLPRRVVRQHARQTNRLPDGTETRNHWFWHSRHFRLWWICREMTTISSAESTDQSNNVVTAAFAETDLFAISALPLI